MVSQLNQPGNCVVEEFNEPEQKYPAERKEEICWRQKSREMKGTG